MRMHSILCAALGLAAAAAGLATPGFAQDGPGTTAAPVLQIPAGSRAAAFAGAYVAARGDVDVVFYNPAGMADLLAGAALSYQRHVADVEFGSGAGALRLGPLVIGLGAAYLDGGEVDVIEPDPNFGGQRGRETGLTASARESAVRVGLAAPIGSLRIGAAAGYVSSDLAGVTRSAPIVDLGAQYTLRRIDLGAAVRNIGGSMSGGDAEDARLPTEVRLGVMVDLLETFGRPLPAAPNLGVVVGADVVNDFRAGVTTLATGLEAGLVPGPDHPFGAVVRLALDHHTRTGETLGRLRLGLGVTLERLAFDYTYQDFEYFGAIHRIGVRWARLHR